MAKTYPLKEGEEIDIICLENYGFSSGSVEAVLKANIEKIPLFDNLGRVLPMRSPESIVLPDIEKPSPIVRTRRLFS